jgi:hypothetical protein
MLRKKWKFAYIGNSLMNYVIGVVEIITLVVITNTVSFPCLNLKQFIVTLRIKLTILIII